MEPEIFELWLQSVSFIGGVCIGAFSVLAMLAAYVANRRACLKATRPSGPPARNPAPP